MILNKLVCTREDRMDDRIREKLREFLLECYGEDINEAKAYFSTSNYAFIFPEKTFMIRVSVTQRRTAHESG